MVLLLGKLAPTLVFKSPLFMTSSHPSSVYGHEEMTSFCCVTVTKLSRMFSSHISWQSLDQLC